MAKTLAQLRTKVLRRLNDPGSLIWPSSDIDFYIREGFKVMALETRVFWDTSYAENFPGHMSYTHAWEAEDAGFDFGQANYTYDWEREEGRSVIDESTKVGPGRYTSPFEVGNVNALGHAMSALSVLPAHLTEIDRATWDNRAIDALNRRDIQDTDSRYELTQGEVRGYIWSKDGIRVLRKVRVPAARCDNYTVEGSWGVARRLTDITSESVTGTWGIPRRIPSWHPSGFSIFGSPRRFFREGKNVRIEHYRHGRAMDLASSVCDLPDRYALYLCDYTICEALRRPGPAQDFKLAQLFDIRWKRGLARMVRRRGKLNKERVWRMGEEAATSRDRHRPPRPKLPWNYGPTVR